MSETEDPRASGRRGGLASVESRRRDRDDPLNRVRRHLPGLMKELMDAAEGKGKWVDLPVALRLQALQRCIEYGVGRPIALDKQPSNVVSSRGEGGEAEAASGLTFE